MHQEVSSLTLTNSTPTGGDVTGIAEILESEHLKDKEKRK